MCNSLAQLLFNIVVIRKPCTSHFHFSLNAQEGANWFFTTSQQNPLPLIALTVHCLGFIIIILVGTISSHTRFSTLGIHTHPHTQFSLSHSVAHSLPSPSARYPWRRIFRLTFHRQFTLSAQIPVLYCTYGTSGHWHTSKSRPYTAVFHLNSRHTRPRFPSAVKNEFSLLIGLWGNSVDVRILRVGIGNRSGAVKNESQAA